MFYIDEIFGETIINDPLAVEIIGNPEFQRLKNVICQGVPETYYCFRGFSRYKHSIGVYLILKQLGANYTEQIAGLLHDISHKAFSHVYDWIIKDYTKSGDNEDAQDNLHSTYINRSSLKALLLRYGLDPSEVFDLDKFRLLDSEIPNLCADRVEYSIRSLTPDFASLVLRNLTIVNDKIVCTDEGIARDYAYRFLSLQNDEWGSPEAATRYYHFSEILKLAMQLNVLSINDFDLDDVYLTRKMLNSGEKSILDKLLVMENEKALYKSDLPDKKVVYKKFRHIDPEILNQKTGDISRLSDIDDLFRQALEESKINNNRGTEFNQLW